MTTSEKTWHTESDARQEQLEATVQRVVDQVRVSVATREPKIAHSFFYGAMGIDPVHLVIWYIFAKDSDKETADKSGLLQVLDTESRDRLRAEGYPPQVLNRIYVSFASEEEIQKAGGWREFFA